MRGTDDAPEADLAVRGLEQPAAPADDRFHVVGRAGHARSPRARTRAWAGTGSGATAGVSMRRAGVVAGSIVYLRVSRPMSMSIPLRPAPGAGWGRRG